MAQLESFNNLSKLSDDLLKKNFCFDQDLAVSIYGKKDGFSVKSNFKQILETNSNHSLTYFQYKNSNFSLKQELSATSAESLKAPNKFKSTLEYTSESKPHLKSKFELDSGAGYQKNTFSLTWSKPSTIANFSVSDDAVLKYSQVFGQQNLGAGFSLTYDFGPVRFTSYNAAVWLTKDLWKIVLKHESTNSREIKPGYLTASLYNSSFFSWKIGANSKFHLTDRTYSALLAAEQKIDENNLFKARANLTGQLAFSLRSRLTDLCQVTAALQFSPFQSSAPNFGLRVKINQ